MNDGVEVKIIKEEDADHPRPEKHPYIAETDTHMRGREDQRRDDEDGRRKEQAHEAYLHRIKIRLGQLTDKDADDPPKYPRQKDREDGEQAQTFLHKDIIQRGKGLYNFLRRIIAIYPLLWYYNSARGAILPA